MKIPSDFHFIFGMTRDGKPFSFIHYLAVVSCHTINRPEIINFYYQYEPTGIWWERAKPYLNTIEIRAPVQIFGNPIYHPAHKADVVRLQVLLEKGGIYLDCDVLCLRPFEPLRMFEVVLGEEYQVGLCNAVILARPEAAFLRRWLESYKSFSAKEWNRHSVIVPWQLAQADLEQIHIVDYQQFFWPMYWTKQLKAFFVNSGSTFCSRSYCVHLWESLTWRFLRQLTPARVWALDSEFGGLVRPYIRPEWLDEDSKALTSEGSATHG